MNLFFISDIVNPLLKTNGEREKVQFCYFCSFECFNCWLVGCCDMWQKILFWDGLKHIFCVPGFIQAYFFG